MKQAFKLSSLKPFRKELVDIPEDDVLRKQFTFDVKILPEEERTIVADVSTTTCDHDGDIIYSRGADISVYLKNSVVQWAHDYTLPPIAKATEVLVGDDRIQMKMEFATTPRAEEIWQLVKGGFLSACSIGFICKSCLIRGTKEFDSFVKEKALKVNDACHRIITSFTLLENSICPVPCNPDALISAISAKSIVVSDGLQKQIMTVKLHDVQAEPKVEEPKVEEVKEVEIEVEEVKKEEPKEVKKTTIMVIRSGFDPHKIAEKDYKDELLMAKGKIV